MKKIWIGLALSGAVVTGGLVVGLVPQTHEYGDVRDIDCGSAFAPNDAPTGRDDTAITAEILGYTPTSGVATTADLVDSCADPLSSARSTALLVMVLGAGAAAATGWMAYSVRRDEAEEWRRRGWVPPGEAPPAGWVRADDLGARGESAEPTGRS